MGTFTEQGYKPWGREREMQTGTLKFLGGPRALNN